jgi:light-regulated signal transduction histidine kinase (bacteriophytochrome)
VERTFVWLRPEQPQTVYWAGDPRKSTLFDSQSQTLSPRSSFAAWLETKTGCAEPWSDTVLLSAKKFRSLLLRQMNADLLHD